MMNKLYMGLLLLLPTQLFAAEVVVDVRGNQGEVLDDIVVFAELPSANYPSVGITLPLQIRQKGKAFAPYISVVQRGRDVRFTNDDDITHHIYSVSGRHQFSFKLASNKERKVLFSAGEAPSEEISMGCNIHDWMTGYLLLLETPYFTRTDKSGRATLNLPDESYKITAWHPQMQAKGHRTSVSYQVKGNGQITITLAKPMLPIPEQMSEEDFDYIDNY